MKKRHVVVVGGGASGLVAAISAARAGANVTIIEQKDRLGKKILSTGNGRCNMTNQYMETECFHGDDTAIVPQILKQFGYQKTLDFFEELGVVLKDRQGYVYPVTDQATTILEALCMELEKLQVRTVLGQSVKNISKTGRGFVIKMSEGSLLADAVILATGGKAASVLGSDGSGYNLAKQFGHRLSPVVPALVQLRCKGSFFKQIAGVRTNAKVTIYINHEQIASDTGELQLTGYGISGIPVFQVSRFASKGLYEKKSVIAEIDFLPSMTEEEWNLFVQERLEKHGYKTADAFWIGVFHSKLIGMLLKEANIPANKVMQEVTETGLQEFVHLCKHFKIKVEGTNDFEQAQVCAGGVHTCEVHSQTLESCREEDLYLTGELLDIDGICGGYNLQWAWSTGFIAGKNAAKGK